MTDIPQQRVASRALPLVRLEHLWVLLALTLIGGFIALSPTSPNDFWWHLKAGQLVATSGIPTTNIFAWSLPADAPFVYQSWLGEWLFYVIYQIGGLPLVVFARNLLGTAAFALVAYEAHRRSGSWRIAAGVVLLAAAMAMNNFTTRTQNWSWVPFVVLLVLLGRYADNQLNPRWLLALPLLMVFWVNVHGGFVMGLLVTLAFVVGETLRRVLKQPRALTWPRLRWLYYAAAGMLVATVVNPLGFGIFGYVRDLLTDAPSQSLINEWQSPTPRNLAGMFFYLGVLLVIAAFAFARRKPTITDVILLCGLAWQAFVGVRYVVWFGMAATPIVAQCFTAARPIFTLNSDAPAPRVSGRERGAGGPANAVVAGALLLVLLAVQPWFKPALPLPAEYQSIFANVPGAPQLFSADTPVAAAEHLRTQPCDGRLLNEMGAGSYLIWALGPQTQVFIDPRVELFPLELWQDYAALSLQRGQTEELLAKHTIACVLLDTGHQPALATEIKTLPGWQRTFNEGRSEVWRRNA